jgi:DNA-binding NarL/FixJ family response regulator
MPVVLVLPKADTATLGLVKAALPLADLRIACDAPSTFIADTEGPELIVARLETLLDGSELVKQLKSASSTAHIPVLGIADWSHRELEQQAIAAGFDAVLLLPVTATTLGDVGRLLIARARLLRERAAHLARTRAKLNTALPGETSAVSELRATADTTPIADTQIASLRCRRCGNDTDSRLVRTTATSLTYRCGRCNAQWRRTHKKPPVQHP